MTKQTNQNDNDRLLLHLMVVGFHHKKGCLVNTNFCLVVAFNHDLICRLNIVIHL